MTETTILYQHHAASAPVESGITLSDTGTFTAYATVTLGEDVHREELDVTSQTPDERVNTMRSLASQAQRLYLDYAAQELERSSASAFLARIAHAQEVLNKNA